jgi:hypothetical protein
MNDLDGHPAIQRGVRGQKNDAHAPTSELALDPVVRSERGLKGGKEVDGCIAHVRDQ